MKSTKDKPKRSLKGKLIFIGLGAIAATLMSYFGIQYYRKRKEENADPNAAPDPVKQTKTKAKPATKTAAAKPGAKKAASKPGASKTADPKAKGQAKQTLDPGKTAKAIHSAILKRDFATALSQVKTLKNTAEYSLVGKVFSTYLTNGVKQTLVNALLTSFKLENQKAAFRQAFTDMGLKYDGKKWSLSGLDGPLLITRQGTKVWRNPKSFVKVPENMLLGIEIAKRGDHSVFQNEGQYYLVESKSVKRY